MTKLAFAVHQLRLAYTCGQDQLQCIQTQPQRSNELRKLHITRHVAEVLPAKVVAPKPNARTRHRPRGASNSIVTWSQGCRVWASDSYVWQFQCLLAFFLKRLPSEAAPATL